MKLLLLGSIGSGKSTQAKILAEDLGFNYIRSGDISREKSLEDTPEGRICKEAVHAGHLVPDEIIAPLVKERVDKEQRLGQINFIFDGYIRRLSQLEIYDPEYDQVVYLELPEADIRERLLHRQREDDSPEVIEERLKVYHAETEPLIRHYENKGILTRIDASGSIEDVTANMENHFKALKEKYQNG